MYTDEPYAQLIPQADRLDIDVLALDDNLWRPMGRGVYSNRIGTYLKGMCESVSVPVEAKEYNNYTGTKLGQLLIAIPTPYNNVVFPHQNFQKFTGFLLMSTLGRLLRNEQWTSYLKAAKPFYDIVIVYAGNGHINSTSMPFQDLPIRLGEKHIIFDFYTTEKNKEADDYAAKSYQMNLDTHAIIPEQVTVSHHAEEIDCNQNANYFYVKIDDMSIKAQLKDLAAQNPKIRSARDFFFPDFVQFAVYIPNKVK